MTNNVDLLTYEAIASSVGDIATATATANALAVRGLAVCRVPGYRHRPTIIGGGDLLREFWLSKHFRPEGSHALNAVGVTAPVGNLSMLGDYRYLSVRDTESAEMLNNPRTRIVPCPAVLTEPLSQQILEQLPRCGLLARNPFKGFVLMHARPEFFGIAAGSTDPIIAIEPTPSGWLPWESAGWRFPLTHSPEVVAALCLRAKAVVTISLHLSILALAVGTPFVCVPAGNPEQIEKVRRYWTRAGFPEVMYSGKHPVQHALSLAPRLDALRRSEQQQAEEHLTQLAKAFA